MEIVDTVYLVAFMNPEDPLHAEAVEVIGSVEGARDRYVSQAALMELDLILKARRVPAGDRRKAWLLLSAVIPYEKILCLHPVDYARAVELQEEMGLDYFDSLIAAQALNRGARVLTTDERIKEAVEKAMMGL